MKPMDPKEIAKLEAARQAKKAQMAAAEPAWQPTWAWHLKVLVIVYAVLIVAYFGISEFLSRVPKPYKMRERPMEVTPWLQK